MHKKEIPFDTDRGTKETIEVINGTMEIFTSSKCITLHYFEDNMRYKNLYTYLTSL